jgi:predicted nuclease of restriction endonuclease-like (RecB) superfamily
MTLLYWRMGNEILARQQREGWGAKVIDRLATDLRNTFSGMRGLSARNLKYMRAFAAAWTEIEFVQQFAAQIPWAHNMVLLDRLSDPELRVFYARKVVENSWTRAVLEAQIANRLHEREGRALSNFADLLPAADAVALQQITRDPYTFDFLDLGAQARERELEEALLTELRGLLLELGVGFAFVGSQVPIDVEGDQFVLDLLFFHIPTRRYVVVDLKVHRFRPADAGQINFYVNVVEDRYRTEADEATIGLVLCASRNEAVVRYALERLHRPVGVARWRAGSSEHELAERSPAALAIPDEEIRAGFARIVHAHAEEIAAAEDAAAEDAAAQDSARPPGAGARAPRSPPGGGGRPSPSRTVRAC